jgi:Metal-dependent hydrolases of the beta-lactamase superfamily I
MYIQILGSAAGGGFPQWNCNCVNCKGFRDGNLRATARTQSSIALSDDGEHWILCNASPDIRAQLQAFAPMQPARALRDTGINAIVLLDSQIDHTTGLLSLREGCPHQVWCTDMVHQDLTTGFPLFNMLSHWNGGLQWNRIELEGSFVIDACPNLRFTPFPCAARAALLAAPLRPAPGRQPRPAGRGHPHRRQAVLRPRPRPGRRQAAADDARRRLPAGRRHAVGG